jgi:hypothetical protein
VYSIDEIMDMLDSANPISIQEIGIELGKKIESINVFFQPANPKHVKNVWGNCAKILVSKPDDILVTYSKQLLEWLQDLNWPGALMILDRLKVFSSNEIFLYVFKKCVEQAVACGENMWLDYLSELLENENLKEELPHDILKELEKRYRNWGKW